MFWQQKYLVPILHLSLVVVRHWKWDAWLYSLSGVSGRKLQYTGPKRLLGCLPNYRAAQMQ